MAFLIKRGNVWHLEWLNPATGLRERFSTGLKANVSTDYREAQALVSEYTAKERRAAVAGPSRRLADRWENWLPKFIESRYRKNNSTRRAVEGCWNTIRLFLKEKGIDTPRQLTREHCYEYLEWRAEPRNNPDRIEEFKRLGRYKVCHNTARLELIHLGVAMKEAVIRGMAAANPCRELGIGKDPANKPIELTDGMLREIQDAIAAAPDCDRAILERSFIIARYHGVRLAETWVNPMKDVDLKRKTITFYQKGGRVREKPMHPKLVPLFKDLQKQQATETFPKQRNFSVFWFNFLKRAGLKTKYPKASFHSLRVTVQNKLRRAGIPTEIRMAYLSHESNAVHDGYSRIGVEELRVCHAVL